MDTPGGTPPTECPSAPPGPGGGPRDPQPELLAPGPGNQLREAGGGGFGIAVVDAGHPGALGGGDVGGDVVDEDAVGGRDAEELSGVREYAGLGLSHAH